MDHEGVDPSEPGESESTFAERQSFPEWFGPAVIVLSVPGLALATLVVLDAEGITLESLGIVAAIALLGLGPIPLLRRASLRTDVRTDGIYFRFRPFHRADRRVAFDEIEDVRRAERRAYQYGVRRTRWGWEYRPNAAEGVELYRRSGPPIFLGSERPHALLTAIEAGMRQNRRGGENRSAAA